jgi:hypothetical protein
MQEIQFHLYVETLYLMIAHEIEKFEQTAQKDLPGNAKI